MTKVELYDLGISTTLESNKSLNAITRLNSQRYPRLRHHYNSSLEENTNERTGLARRLEIQGLRRRSKRATPMSHSEFLRIRSYEERYR